ncbi:MAG: transporter substrate-binding domain-containing protein [Bavariicoccus seileri]|uniref:transporter substrate-binding domain-containing protein n=1 Tax=Bavariicoccus seileri TaxID=549685 RepID=UPI003F98B0D4
MTKRNSLTVLFTLIPLLLLTLLLGACSSNNSSTNDSADSPDKLAQIKEAKKLVVGTSPDYPPMEFYILNDDGEKEIIGSDISLAQAIADEIGVELEIKPTDFNGVLANVQTGSVDLGITGFSYTEERAEAMDLSDGYQQETEDGYQGILVTKETAAKYKTLDELKEADLAVGAQGGSIQTELATHITSATNIKQYGTNDDAILALNAGDIGAVAVLTSAVEPVLASFPDLTILPQDEFDLDPDNLYGTNVVGIPKEEGNESLIELVNKVIKENQDNGNIEKWKQEAIEQSTNAIEE